MKLKKYNLKFKNQKIINQMINFNKNNHKKISNNKS